LGKKARFVQAIDALKNPSKAKKSNAVESKTGNTGGTNEDKEKLKAAQKRIAELENKVKDLTNEQIKATTEFDTKSTEWNEKKTALEEEMKLLTDENKSLNDALRIKSARLESLAKSNKGSKNMTGILKVSNVGSKSPGTSRCVTLPVSPKATKPDMKKKKTLDDLDIRTKSRSSSRSKEREKNSSSRSNRRAQSVEPTTRARTNYSGRKARSATVHKRPTSKQKGIPKNKNDVVYVLDEDLAALDNPKEVADRITKQVVCGDWLAEFSALNDLRTLALHHTKLVTPLFPEILTRLATQLENLRSSIVKNSLMCTRVFFQTFGPEGQMDGFVAKNIIILVKCATENNKFLAEEGDLVLEEMVNSATQKKVLYACIDAAGENSPSYQAKGSQFMVESMRRMEPLQFDEKILKKLVNVLPPLLYAKMVECRNYANEAVKVLGEQCANAGSSTAKLLDLLCSRMIDKKFSDRWEKSLKEGKKLVNTELAKKNESTYRRRKKKASKKKK